MKVTQKKRSNILPYGFIVEPERNEIPADVIPTILEWMFENIGPYDKKRWQMRNAMGSVKKLSIFFAHEEDAIAFKLVWS